MTATPAAIPTPLTFTSAERAILAGMESRGFRLTTCAEDGDEWAAFVPVTVGPFDDPLSPTLSVQLTGEPGRRFVLLNGGGRETAADEDLGMLLGLKRSRRSAAVGA